jgi:hypothetical protein
MKMVQPGIHHWSRLPSGLSCCRVWHSETNHIEFRGIYLHMPSTLQNALAIVRWISYTVTVATLRTAQGTVMAGVLGVYCNHHIPPAVDFSWCFLRPCASAATTLHCHSNEWSCLIDFIITFWAVTQVSLCTPYWTALIF